MSRAVHRYRASVDLLGPQGDLLWAKACLPQPVPRGWRLLEDGLDGGCYRHANGLAAIVSGAREADGRRWLHLSLSRKDRLPTWDDLRAAKEAFLGDRYAVQVLPPRRLYVNINPRVLHLFALADPADPWPLPEFSLGGVTL